MAAVTIYSDFEVPENEVSLFPFFSPSICHEVMWLNAIILVFWMLSFKPTFSLSSFTFIKNLFSSSSLSAISVLSSAYLRLLIFLPLKYDLNQIHYDYIVEVANRFKGLDLVDKMPEELWMRFIGLYRRQWSKPFPRNAKRQNHCLRRP